MSAVDDRFPHLVIPGQVIAVSCDEDSFLRGHGPYVETLEDGKIQLRASITGVVQRTNKLISVESVALNTYTPQVGDLVVGRLTSIGNARWNVDLGTGVSAHLPLTGVHLPGSVQRMRTAADALEMRSYLREGDLVSAEVHKVLHNNSIMLHTRSVRYGKLENGCVIQVPAKLVARRKAHNVSILQFQLLLGVNGMFWIQRQITSGTEQQELAEAQEQRQREHATTPYTTDERRELARLYNAISCLRVTLSEITPERIEEIVIKSAKLPVSQMLLPEQIVKLTTSVSS